MKGPQTEIFSNAELVNVRQHQKEKKRKTGVLGKMGNVCIIDPFGSD